MHVLTFVKRILFFVSDCMIKEYVTKVDIVFAIFLSDCMFANDIVFVCFVCFVLSVFLLFYFEHFIIFVVRLFLSRLLKKFNR